MRSANSLLDPKPLPGCSDWKQKRWREQSGGSGRGVGWLPLLLPGWGASLGQCTLERRGAFQRLQPWLWSPRFCTALWAPVMPCDPHLQAQPSQVPTIQCWPAGDRISGALVWHPGLVSRTPGPFLTSTHGLKTRLPLCSWDLVPNQWPLLVMGFPV